MRRHFALATMPYGPIRAIRPRTMKSRAGLRPAPSPGRICQSIAPMAFATAMANITAATRPPTIRTRISLGIASFAADWPSSGRLASWRPERTAETFTVVVAIVLHLLRERIHEENEPELGHRDHQ